MRRGALLAAACGAALCACAAVLGVADVPYEPADGGVAEASAETGSDAGSACDPTKPFGPTVALPSPLDTNAQEFSGFLTDDELTIYLGVGGDLVVSSRDVATSAWPMPRPLAINSAVADNAPFLTPDGQRLYFDSRRVCDACAPSNDVNIWVATRTGDVATFAPPTMFAGGRRNDLHPWLNPAGEIMYFAHGFAAPFDLDVRRVAGQGADPPSLAALDTTFDEEKPVVTADELTIYFGTNRATGAGMPLDVWRATRTSKDQPFGDPEPVAELNDPDPASDDVPSWVSVDGCRILVERTNASTGNAPDLFLARRPPR
ncbi:MAG TPA: hypothetical protein VIF62_39540 [Labilithrix sp.]|jgi:hypothetical protein